MIKTIKLKKKLRLDELIKYAFDNNIKNVEYVSSGGAIVQFDKYGNFEIEELYHVRSSSLFTVEGEMHIEENTRFEKVVVIYRTYNDGKVKTGVRNNKTIQQMLDGHGNSDVLKIYALIEEELEMIWEREEK